MSVNVCFIWLDAEMAFFCFETAVNLLKTRLFLWQSNFSSVCLMGAKCAAVTEQLRVKGKPWRTHSRLKWILFLVRLDADVDALSLKAASPLGSRLHSERSRFRLSYWRLLGLLCVRLFKRFIVFLVMFAQLLQHRVSDHSASLVAWISQIA